MKACSKRLLLAIAIIIPYITQGIAEQGAPDDIPRLIQDAEKKVTEANRANNEMQASFNEVTQLRFTLQVMTDEILQTPLDDLAGSIEVVEALLDRTAQLLTSQSKILRILNEQLLYLPQIEPTVRLVRDYQQRIRAQADDDLSTQNIEHLLQQLHTHKNTIEEATQDTKEFAQEAVVKTVASITKIKNAVELLTGQPDLPEQEQQALTIVTHIITLLLEIEQSIQTLLEKGLYESALQGASVVRNVQSTLLPITPNNILAMQNKAQQAQVSTDGVKNLLIPAPPIPTDDGSTDTPTTPGQPPHGPNASTPTPTTPTRRTAPPVGPSGRALENIKKVNLKLESAIRRLEAAKNYFNQIEAAERTIVKKKADRIFKEYESGLRKFATRIRQVKTESGLLDQEKLAPFNKFLELTDKLSAKVKNL